MQTVNMLEAKSNLSRLVEAIEQGKEREIVIARNGRLHAWSRSRSNRPSDASASPRALSMFRTISTPVMKRWLGYFCSATDLDRPLTP
jgi:antitoxin (DNA-binding transcriptional repressor) of toxin-antitoxin stability system